MRRRRREKQQPEVKSMRRPSACRQMRQSNATRASLSFVATAMLMVKLFACLNHIEASSAPTSAIRFEPESNSYTGLTFTFDPRLDKRVEWLHFEHWLSIMQQSSMLLYEALGARAHLAEVRVLIPYKWRQFEWPVLHKPGSPIMMNRRVRYADSDVLVGFEDPIYKETPFSVQHDECARQGLNIRMPISFLEQNQLDTRLKARLLIREFASHRYGIFKESGFRSDFTYPPFAALPGVSGGSSSSRQRNPGNRTQLLLLAQASEQQASSSNQSAQEQLSASIRGFDELWNECNFETSPGSGLPTPQAAQCAPYLTRQQSQQADQQQQAQASFNLMSADPFSHLDLAQRITSRLANQPQPLEWRELADSLKWHFCGHQFQQPQSNNQLNEQQVLQPEASQPTKQSPLSLAAASSRPSWFAHNQLATNKQNVLCQERSAMDVIRASEDFKRAPFSPSNFNRLPAPNFKFMQEMPPRLILCVEYSAHLYQSRRLDHGILEAAIAKWLAFDLIPDTEVALVLFGQHHSSRNAFKRLDSSLDSRLTLYSPPIDPFDEAPKLYSEQDLAQLDIQASGGSQQARLVKGTCSFAKLMAEANALMQQRNQYDDVGADVVVVTSGLFIEDELKIEEILKAIQFKPEQVELHLIIYPSTMLFDTKSRDGFIVLDAIESEAIIRNRVAKLLLIQRLTNAKIHLVKEHLDSNGDVKMSTLLQFYKIFEHISKGHSWDQTNSMLMIASQAIEARQSQTNSSAASQFKLQFQFELDNSLQEELIVGFIDPKQSATSRSGKRFAIKNLQLRSPSGQLVLTDSHPWSGNQQQAAAISGSESINSAEAVEGADSAESENLTRLHPVASSTTESALFPYRTQLSLAGFHLKPAHLAPLNESHRLAGLWTLTGTSDEAIQSNGVALARVNPNGDSLVANCWIQSYFTQSQSEVLADGDQHRSAQNSGNGQQQLKAVKVFVETRGASRVGFVQEVNARMEVQDEMGNIVQNVNMLDDGLGAPDITKGDGIHSQYVQRAYRPGYYKVSVELSGTHSSPPAAGGHQHLAGRKAMEPNGQDRPCCGGSIPASGQQPSTRHLSRQLYCGTFYVDINNRLAQQRPPRVNNLTVAQVDQENRRVTIRWQEPLASDISVPQSATQSNARQLSPGGQTASTSDSNDLNGGAQQDATDVAGRKHLASRSMAQREEEQEEQRDVDMVFESMANSNQQVRANSLLTSQRQKSSSAADHQDQAVAPLSNRYEIRLFSDRDAAKRAFDAKQEVGFRFNEWNVEGTFPNASAYGGLKEVTLRIPYGREGIYYIAMKVYNNLGAGSQTSNIVQFWIRNNLTADEAESIYGQPTTVDADGNVYDKNGELIQRAGGSLLKGGSGSALDGLSVLIFVSIVAFVFSIICISLVACLVGSARKSIGSRNKQGSHHHSSGESEDRKAVAAASAMIAGAGSGSSMVSSGCASSSTSDAASSVASGSQGGHDVEINKLALNEPPLDTGNHQHLSYMSLKQQQQRHQQQAQLIHQNHIQMIHADPLSYQPADTLYARQQYQSGKGATDWLQHTMVNGYAYATVQQQQHQADDSAFGSLNQNGLSAAMSSPVQSWPADILLSHYDKVKQARERNEAPPVMRIETLEHPQGGQFSSDGLPVIADDQQQQQSEPSYLARLQRNQMPSYFNQQLQQQLSSVLKSKHQQRLHENDVSSSQQTLEKTSPALEGLTDFQDFQDTSGGGYNVPPPQYMQYCSPVDLAIDGLANQIHCQPINEPSIYSQVTNLQLVQSATDHSGNNQPTSPVAQIAYYANQWQASGNNNNNNNNGGAQTEQFAPKTADKSAISEV